MGLRKKLELSVLSEEETTSLRESYLSQSMSGMKSAIRTLNVETSAPIKESKQSEVTPRYENTELADVAREVYRENINPKKEKAEFQNDGPNTHARRVGERSIQRAIMGLRNGGDEGKVSMVGPNGSGNVGKYSPSADAGSGNATNNYNNYYALTTDMTLEEYEAYINGKFGLEEAAPLIAMTAGKMAGAAATKGIGKAYAGTIAKGGLKGKAAQFGANKAGEMASAKVSDLLSNDEDVAEDYIQDLKAELLQLEDSDWQAIDKVMRKIAKENYITPKQLHKEFKAQHGGQIPDEWLKENRDMEMAGFIPLNELAQLNPVGSIYEVMYAFRGGTQRQKFLWPSTEPPTREQMEEVVRGFWPFARLLSFYPVMLDNEQNSNTMIAVPPVTENYKFYTPEDWIVLSPEDEEIYYKICEEEGEPLTAPEQQADGTYALLVSDHDTGEQKYITFGENNSFRRDREDQEADLYSGTGETDDDVTKQLSKHRNNPKHPAQIDSLSRKYRGHAVIKGKKPANTIKKEEYVGEGMSKDEWDEKLKAASEATQKRQKDEYGVKTHDTEGVKDMFKIGSKKRDLKKEEEIRELIRLGYLDEGSLHAWFSKSKSKDGKGGWVQSDGSTCARKPGQKSAPKCYSSQRLASLKKSDKGKKLIRSADARKKSEDSGQSSKSGAAKPTYVSTFKDPKDKKKYKSGDQTIKDESYDPTIDEACWKGYTQKGMKTMFGKQYPNCVKKTKKEEVEYVDEGAWQRKEGKNPSGGLNEKGRKSYERENPGSDLKAPQPEGGPRKKSFCARMGGVKGPMKDEKGRPTRKALALRKWKC